MIPILLIAYFKGEEKVVSALNDWRSEGRAFIISSITLSELLSLPGISREQIENIKTFLGAFVSVPFDDRIGEIASSLRRAYRLSLPDAGIAATAIATNTLLITRDHELCKVKEIRIMDI